MFLVRFTPGFLVGAFCFVLSGFGLEANVNEIAFLIFSEHSLFINRKASDSCLLILYPTEYCHF